MSPRRLSSLAILPALIFSLPAAASRLPVMAVKRPTAGQWMGLYLLGHKAGYTFDRVWEERRGGKNVVVAVDDITLRATLGGRDVSRRVREERVFEAKAHGRLIAFSALHEGDGGDETIEGPCDARGMHLVRRRPGGSPERLELPPARETVEDADLPRLAAARKTTLSGLLFDSMTLKELPQEATWLGTDEWTAGGSLRRVERVALTQSGGTVASKLSIDPASGRLLRLTFGGSLTAVPESERVAKTLDSVDLFALTRVPVDGTLPFGVVPETVRYRVEGLPPALRPAPERQRYRDLPGGAVEITVRAAEPDRRAERPERAPMEDLAATPDIESDAPAIRALARKIAGKEKDAFTAANLLSSWVFANVRSAYGVSSDRATDVLRRKEGDCTEHSLLTVALCRAIGIPARLVHGLVYAQGSDEVWGLYWHEWVEVWVSEWIAIDPTFGQPVADATHIELGEGEATDAVGLMGQLKISVLRRDP